MVVKLKGVENSSNARRELTRISNKMKHLHDDHTDLRFSRWKTQAILTPAKNVQTVLPYATIFAVTVDAAVDGILIGLALSAEHAAGISMAIATIIEVNFFVFLFSSMHNNVSHVFSLVDGVSWNILFGPDQIKYELSTETHNRVCGTTTVHFG